MKKIYMPYVNSVTKLDVPVFERRRVIAVAIAQAISCNMALPSGPISSPTEYYDTVVQPEVLSLISIFNEEAVLATQAAVDYTRRFFMMRYDAYAKCPRRERPTNDFFHAFFGVTDYFSEDDIRFFTEYKDGIFDIYSAVCDCIQEAMNARIQCNENAASIYSGVRV